MNPLAAQALVMAQEFREKHQLEKNAIVTLSMPDWAYNQLGEETLALLNMDYINVEVRCYP